MKSAKNLRFIAYQKQYLYQRYGDSEYNNVDKITCKDELAQSMV